MRRVWRYLWRGLALAIVLGVGYLGYRAPELGRLAVDISAKWACQCRYIDGGEPQFCVGEDPVPLGGITFRFDDGRQAVTTDIWGLVSATGRYAQGGCFVE